MAVSADYLNKLRRALKRGQSADIDAELTDVVEECRQDMVSLGVLQASVEDETDSLILGTVRCYVRWKLAPSIEDAAQNRDDYMQLRDELRRKSSYTEAVTST